jgi:cephalosporin hydroxylase
MVVLDSDHTAAHVFAELTLLAPLVTPGCYLVVEDTIVNGNPVLPDFGPGPAEAVARYLALEPSLFVVDRDREKFRLTFNPGGYLRRIGT